MEQMTRAKALEAVQDVVDYWIEEGGTWECLRDQVLVELDGWADELKDRKEDTDWVLTQCVPHIHMLTSGLAAIDATLEEEAARDRITVQDLLEDYAVYVGVILSGDETDAEPPITYLESYMEAHTQPPKAVCIEFLTRFHAHAQEDIENWVKGIAWDEDEEVDVSYEMGLLNKAMQGDLEEEPDDNTVVACIVVYPQNETIHVLLDKDHEYDNLYVEEAITATLDNLGKSTYWETYARMPLEEEGEGEMTEEQFIELMERHTEEEAEVELNHDKLRDALLYELEMFLWDRGLKDRTDEVWAELDERLALGMIQNTGDLLAQIIVAVEEVLKK